MVFVKNLSNLGVTLVDPASSDSVYASLMPAGSVSPVNPAVYTDRGQISNQGATSDAFTRVWNAGKLAVYTDSGYTQQLANPAALTNYIATLQANVNVKVAGARGDGVTDDTAAIQAAFATLAPGGELFFPHGTYLVSGLVLSNASNFTLKGAWGSEIWIAPSTVSAPTQVTHNVITITDCTDFNISGLTINGRRDVIAPLAALTANAVSGQATVKVANGAGAAYVVGQQLSVIGGLTANSNSESNQTDTHMVIQSITPGASGAADTIAFTTNLSHNYTAGGSVVSDSYGPMACNGAYVTPWQTGKLFPVAGRTLSEEDQQNGIHLLNCKRFRIESCAIKNVWQSGIRLGTHDLSGGAQADRCSDGIVSGNVINHTFDQGVGVWCSPHIRVADNVIDSTGWGNIVLTGAADCSVSGNICKDAAGPIPGDNVSGYGIAIQGGARNTITGNKISYSTNAGVLLTVLTTLPFASPSQVATSVTSNNVALPTSTINLISTTGFASSGTVSVLSSAGVQFITYTGISGNSLTGCSGGVGTLYSGLGATQYPLFITVGASVGATSLTVSDGTKLQVGGFYSLIDGPRTEQFTVTAVAGNTITLSMPLGVSHMNKTQIGQAVSESNTIVANSISSPGDAGIRLAASVRTQISGNVIDHAALNGVDGVAWNTGILQPPAGTVLSNNIITAPGSSGSLAYFSAVSFASCSDIVIQGNRCGGTSSTNGTFHAMKLQAISDSVISENTITDSYAIGIRVEPLQEWVNSRLQIVDNVIDRTFGEGIILYGGDSLNVSNNVLHNCAANNGGAGYGGALDVRGVKNSQFIGNLIVDNGHNGIGLDSATIGGTTVYTSGNRFSGNVVRDTGHNVDPFNFSPTQQGTGINELSNGQGPNTFVDNIVSGNGTNWSITSTGNTFRGNTNWNPVGKFSSQPTVPASGTAYTNILNADATAYVAGGTVTGIAVGGQATGLTSGAFRVLAGQTITLTYSSAPTWIWFGD